MSSESVHSFIVVPIAGHTGRVVMHEIAAIHNANERVAPCFANGVYFIRPAKPTERTYTEQPFQIVCRGIFTEIVVDLLKQHEREKSLFSALVNVLGNVSGTYALVLVSGNTLIAAHSLGYSLFAGKHGGALLVATDPKLLIGHNVTEIQELPPGQVLCRDKSHYPMWATPSRRMQQHVN